MRQSSVRMERVESALQSWVSLVHVPGRIKWRAYTRRGLDRGPGGKPQLNCAIAHCATYVSLRHVARARARVVTFEPASRICTCVRVALGVIARGPWPWEPMTKDHALLFPLSLLVVCACACVRVEWPSFTCTAHY